MRISDWSSDVCSSDLQYWQNQLRAREDHLPSQERYSPRVCGYCTEPTMKREGRRVRKQGAIIGRTLTTLSLLTNLSLLLFLYILAEGLSTVKRLLLALAFCVWLFLFLALHRKSVVLVKVLLVLIVLVCQRIFKKKQITHN